MSDESGEKKIIIDEDWKSRVDADREEAKAKSSAASDGAASEDAAPVAEQTSVEQTAVGPMPPASFEMLLTTLAAEAMVSLGQVTNPITGKAEVNLDQAKYFIDTLQMLEEKTQGNLTSEENGALTMLLSQLQMAFVGVKNQTADQPVSGTST